MHRTPAQGCLFPLPVQLISSSKRLVFYCGSVFQLSLKNDFELILHGTPAIRTKSLEYGLGSPSLTLTLFLLNLEGAAGDVIQGLTLAVQALCRWAPSPPPFLP